jgi:hypothetical protein
MINIKTVINVRFLLDLNRLSAYRDSSYLFPPLSNGNNAVMYSIPTLQAAKQQQQQM